MWETGKLLALGFGSWLRISSAPAVMAAWAVNQQTDYLSVSSLAMFQIINKYFKILNNIIHITFYAFVAGSRYGKGMKGIKEKWIVDFYPRVPFIGVTSKSYHVYCQPCIKLLLILIFFLQANIYLIL